MLASLQIDDTQAFTLDTNIIARLAGEFRHFLDQPRLGLFNVFGLFTSTSNFVTHSGLGKKIDPLLQGRESHLAFVSFFGLTLTPTLHDKRWELFDLEFGNSISLALLNTVSLERALKIVGGLGLLEKSNTLGLVASVVSQVSTLSLVRIVERSGIILAILPDTDLVSILPS